MVVVQEVVHPLGLDFRNQQKVVVLRDQEQGAWESIAAKVRNRKGKPTTWKTASRVYNRFSKTAGKCKYKFWKCGRKPTTFTPEVKKHLVAELDAVLGDTAMIATNTSTLPVVELAMATARPDRVCGLHFFNPATAMPLVEVVQPVTAAESTVETIEHLAADCGKESVRVADRAGFVVNALLFPYLNSAIALAEHGVASRADVDRAMRGGCNFPMGPFELLDLIGLDTTLRILETLHRENGDAASLPHPELRRLVAAGHLGRKTGRGFLEYEA